MIKIILSCFLVLFFLLPGTMLSARKLGSTDIRIIFSLARALTRNRHRKSPRTKSRRRDKSPPSSTRYRQPVTRSSLTRKDIEFLIRHYSRKHGFDPRFIKAVVTIESNFDSSCLSGAGAMGLMQLMPLTARQLGVKNPWNPVHNIAGGVKYLAQLRNSFNDNELLLAAYNAGPGNVRKYNGIPPFKETRRYVKKVLAAYRQYCQDG